VYRLFLKIFFWFWSTALGILVLIWMSFFFSGIKEISSPNMYATVAPILAAEAVHAYESGGPQEFARFIRSNIDDPHRKLYMLDGYYKDVLSRPVEDDGLKVARAAKVGRLVMFRGRIAAYKVISPTGRPYVFLLYSRSEIGRLKFFLLGNGIPFAVSMFILASLFSLWLAYHIASPIYSIQAAARRVAVGDLKARVPPGVSKRHDELAALAVDFDSMVDRLEALIRAQKELLSSVSHEVRSPLARINLCLGILKKGWSASSVDVICRMENDVSRVDLLMGQLLMLSRLEARLSSADREEVDLVQILEEVTADGHFEAQPFGKSVTLRAANSVHLENADPHAIRSAFENIIRNAIRFTRSGTEVQVTAEIDRTTPESLVLIYVRDCGPGVPEGSLEAIFQPFVQIAADEGQEKGNGLGLAIASEAIRMHGGTVSAVNLPGEGLEVCVRLPAVKRSASPMSDSPQSHVIQS
jgi:signal transduction histidine kinase